ncbi:MAG: winged helix-turn-helix transcriptional regulator [Clostridia bacterium]|nr:winged helix-turn-helix transcriptional regulator [Clostridia bacterium]
MPTGLSTDEFFAGRSLPRNKELMRIFSDLDMSEQLGTGMKKILRQYPKDIFDISEHFLSVKFMYNKEAQGIIDGPKVADKIKNDPDNDPNNDSNDSNNDPNNLDEVSKKILQILQERPEISRKELVELLNKSLKTIGRKLAALKNGGYIERIGSNRSGYWKVIK